VSAFSLRKSIFKEKEIYDRGIKTEPCERLSF
jgi:hypothetical protein